MSQPVSEEDNDPTVVAPLAAIHELKRKPTPMLIEGLKQLLDDAVTGKVIGAVVLVNMGDGYTHYHIRHHDLPSALLALEAWKFNQIAQRELICPECGHTDD